MLEIVHILADQNPVQVFVDAIINSGPREDSTRVGSAGVVRRQAVDVSPIRRVNEAIYLMTTGSREASFRNLKTIAECLADEIINAARGSSNSYAIKKKDEIERVAKANRWKKIMSFSSSYLSIVDLFFQSRIVDVVIKLPNDFSRAIWMISIATSSISFHLADWTLFAEHYYSMASMIWQKQWAEINYGPANATIWIWSSIWRRIISWKSW